MIDPVALKTELDTDPNGLGYAVHMASGNNTALVLLLNEPHAADQVNRGIVPAHEVITSTDAVEWAALSDVEKSRYDTITGAGEVDASAVNVRAAFAAMFGAGTTTRANLLAIGQRDGSRIEALFGAGVTATLDDVRKARVS